MQITKTKETQKFKKFIDEKEEILTDIMCRWYDEKQYEDRKEYVKAFTKILSKLGDVEEKKDDRYEFVFTIKLNDFQLGKVVLDEFLGLSVIEKIKR